MKLLPRLLVSLVAAGLALSIPARAADASASKKKVLFFTKSSGYEHEAIQLKMKNGRPGYAYAVLSELGEKNNIEFTFSKDGHVFTPEYLAQFDAYVFYTTGDLTKSRDLKSRGDDNLSMTVAGKAAFLQAIAAGKGFVGLHSATDTFHSPGDDEGGPARHQTNGADVDPYVKMIGAEFIRHGDQQPARQIVADAKFPGMGAVPADFGPNEEWYAFKNFAPDLHVLLVQDTSAMKGPMYARASYPSTWARMHEKGRVFYTSMGHREDVWTNPVFQAVLAGGLDWALRRVDADVTPNLARVAPQANVLPTYIPPAPKPAPAAAAPTVKTEPPVAPR
jgi:type 1 glutamine amidotransferase